MTGKRAARPRAETVFRGRVFTVRRHTLVEPGGVPAVREVIHHRGSAVILPCLPGGRIVLIRQFRLAARSSLWELPAGSIDAGESARQTARRELEEETGYRSSQWRKLVEFYPSPGFLDERMTLFLAANVLPGAPRPEADERILVRSFRLSELLGMISSGRIRDGKTLVGLLYWSRFRARAR
ncbi:MAG TPA: NUDIX hydrolase [Terriglobia bacterium]|jgi:ADP-ribose pyrophosphatase